MGSKHPVYRENTKKQLSHQQMAVGQAPGGHYQIIKRINPLILSRDLNLTDLVNFINVKISKNSQIKKPNHEDGV